MKTTRSRGEAGGGCVVRTRRQEKIEVACVAAIAYVSTAVVHKKVTMRGLT